MTHRLIPPVLLAATLACLLTACSSLPSWVSDPMGTDTAKPAALAPDPRQLAVRLAWTTRLAPVNFPVSTQAVGNSVLVAAGDGTVVRLDAATGAVQWRSKPLGPLAAGVGGDADLAVVATANNELVALSKGQALWRQKLSHQVYTAPFVAGGRVFVLGADRSVSAFDAQNGLRLWTQQRPGEPLTLRQSGVMLAVGNTLLAGQGGRLTGFNPDNGSLRWDAAIATSRGTNDVERLVDLVGRVSRVGDSVCVRAFQAAVGCVDAGRGALLWTRSADGAQGLGGDDRQIFGAESDGRVIAWRRSDGERQWAVDSLRLRGLSAPVLLGRSVALGDATGFVHLLSRENGSLLARLSTDGSAIVATPTLVGNTLVVVTRSGGVFGFTPE
ncbi:MAG: outer membrane protein assembly factor BamB [Ramlibacter sp.]|uniref:outer membrane protein assembly factor BamB n=1 Tax=Ramlibacter sp. TaxID=1917967 RepID=UPI0026038C1D|nr:outer membrane protein assembly factor BamB [Ramlibacter sp.]MDH4376448.1 outer membrane protein assembly factor BamB [Ramlibacter sp.]